MQLQPNTLFDNRYTLKRLIGRGGFAEVWLVEDTLTGLEEALKIYAPGAGMDEDGMRMFIKELQVVHGLRHSSLLAPKSMAQFENQPYLVMEFCPNGSLVKRVGTVFEDEAWKILKQVASGLAYLHEGGIVHQDIKPDNILIDARGNYVITDFGISLKAQSTLRKSMRDAANSGTMAYMAPERFSADPDPRPENDIWSLGAMLFEMIHGNVPFMAQMGGLAQKNGAETPTLKEEVTDTLKQTIYAMLAQDISARPTAAELVKMAETRQAPVPQQRESTITPQPQHTPASQPDSHATQRIDMKQVTEQPIVTSTPTSQSESRATQRIEMPSSEEALPSSPSPSPALSTASQPDKPKKTGLWWKNSLPIFALLILAFAIIWPNVTASVTSEAENNEQTASASVSYDPNTSEIMVNNNPVLKMVEVQGGTFQMGSNQGDGDEQPIHQVTLSSYSLGKTEVTQALWEAVMGSNPSEFKGQKNPVECVSWNDCQTFIKKLNTLTGQNFRLPTEAEWEFAARGGNNSKGYKYAGSNNIDEVAWYDNNSNDETHPVAQKKPNELGLYDMSGNVWEWCQDWYGAYSPSAQTNPKGPQSGDDRVLRGGGWCSNADCCRCTNRVGIGAVFADDDLGLRLAL